MPRRRAKRIRPRQRPRTKPREWESVKVRTERTTMLLSPDEYRTLRAGAKLTGLTIAAFCRTAGLLEAARLLSLPTAQACPVDESESGTTHQSHDGVCVDPGAS